VLDVLRDILLPIPAFSERQYLWISVVAAKVQYYGTVRSWHPLEVGGKERRRICGELCGLSLSLQRNWFDWFFSLVSLPNSNRGFGGVGRMIR
jgi:hypothetical protein